jgi:hypothetical protein
MVWVPGPCRTSHQAYCHGCLEPPVQTAARALFISERYEAPAIHVAGNASRSDPERIRVPPPIVPGEFNVLLNPLQPRRDEMRVLSRFLSLFDPRPVRDPAGTLVTHG